MSNELPKLTNNPIELKIGEVTIQAKKAGLKELALFTDFVTKLGKDIKTSDIVYKILPYALYLSIRKVYPEVTEEYVNDLLPPDVMMKTPDLMWEYLIQLGFPLPPPKKKEETPQTNPQEETK